MFCIKLTSYWSNLSVWVYLWFRPHITLPFLTLLVVMQRHTICFSSIILHLFKIRTCDKRIFVARWDVTTDMLISTYLYYCNYPEILSSFRKSLVYLLHTFLICIFRLAHSKVSYIRSVRINSMGGDSL